MAQEPRPSRFPLPLTILFVLCLALTGVAAVALVSASMELAQSNRQVEHTLQVQKALETLHLTIESAETGQRGFLLSGQSHFLQPYIDAVARQAYYIGTLEGLVADNPTQARSLHALKTLVDQRLVLLSKTIALYRDESERAQVLDSLNQGKAVMDQISVAIEGMRNEEDRLLAQRQAEVEQRSRYGLMFLLLSNAASVLGLLVLYLAMRRYHWRRHAAEVELVRSEQRLRQLFETSAIGQAECDPQSGRFLLVNRRLCEMTGYSADELRRTTLSDLLPRANRLDNARALRQLVDGAAREIALEQVATRKDGTTLHAVVHATHMRGSDGKPGLIALAIEDASERNTLIEEAGRNRGLLRAIIDGAQDAVCAKDTEGRWLLANQRALDLAGRTRDQVLDRRDRELFEPSPEVESLHALDVQVMTSRKIESRELRLSVAGTAHTVLWTSVPWLGEHGELIGTVGVATVLDAESDAQTDAAAEPGAPHA